MNTAHLLSNKDGLAKTASRADPGKAKAAFGKSTPLTGVTDFLLSQTEQKQRVKL